MIYTVTCNPSLDYIVKMNQFELGMVNRTREETMLPGGKGINVSIVLNHLGIKSVALGFVAGFTGNEIEKRVKEFGCTTDFIHLKNGISRINVKLKMTPETEINGQGPSINEQEINALYHQLDQIRTEDLLVLAGSIPNTLPDTMYEDILERIQAKKCKVVVDATGELLVKVLRFNPFLIKPNHHELGEIFNKTLSTQEEIIAYGKKLQEMGARNVLISMAKDGAILISEDNKVYITQAPKGKVMNSVGAGDSMVAGFLAGYLDTNQYEDAFFMGVAAGSASAFSKNLATKKEVLALLTKLKSMR